MDQAPGFNIPLGEPELPFPDFPRETGVPGLSAAIDQRLRENDDELLKRLHIDLNRDIEYAIGAKSQLDRRVERYRMYQAMDRDPPAYEGAPNHRVPYIRAKNMGATAHFRSALDQDPFFVVRPYTKDGADHKGPLETMMERELDRSLTRRQVWRGIAEACTTGTGVLQLSVTRPFDEYLVQARCVRLEDFYVIPPGNEDVSRVSTFLRYWEPWHIIRGRVEAGEYDEERAEALKPRIVQRPTNYQEAQDGTTTFVDQSENTAYELWECYYRWGTEDIGYELWRIIYSKDANSIVSATVSPYAAAFDAPPYVPLRVMPQQGYFYGDSYSQVLEGIQHVMDWSYNSLLAYDQFAMTPPTFVDADSELYAALKDTGLLPNSIIPTRGPPKESIYQAQMMPAREPYQLLMALRSLGEDATFSDLQLQGIPTNTVRSATEIGAIQNAASKKLSEDLSNLSEDLSTFGRMYWSLIYHFKILPKGVLPVFKGSDQYLIAARDIDEEELMQHMAAYMESVGIAPMGVSQDPQAVAQMQAQMEQQGIKVFVASAKRDDIEWLPNGAKLVADRLVHANKMERLVGGLLPALSFARQDRAAWHIMKEYLIALDLHNWEDFLPPQPPETFMDPQQMAQFAQMMEQTRQGGGSGS
jgi:hypothetical protein